MNNDLYYIFDACLALPCLALPCLADILIFYIFQLVLLFRQEIYQIFLTFLLNHSNCHLGGYYKLQF